MANATTPPPARWEAVSVLSPNHWILCRVAVRRSAHRLRWNLVSKGRPAPRGGSDLLAACEVFIDTISEADEGDHNSDGHDPSDRCCLCMARAAIAKAQGG